MKTAFNLVLVAGLSLGSTVALADWSGDLLCTKATYSRGGRELVADAKGRVTVKMVDGMPVAEVKLSDLRLFTNYGSTRGSKLKNLPLAGDVADGNDMWFSTTSPKVSSKIIKTILFDLSSLERGLSEVTTLKGNVYKMDCMVRED